MALQQPLPQRFAGPSGPGPAGECSPAARPGAGEAHARGSGYPMVQGTRYDSQFYKTKLCMFWQTGRCTRRNCKYAHGEQELQQAPDLTRTAMCRMVLADGRCNDPTCKFAHGLDDLRTTNNFFKTTMCCFSPDGACKLGDQCRYAHSRTELRMASDTRSQQLSDFTTADGSATDELVDDFNSESPRMWERASTMPTTLVPAPRFQRPLVQELPPLFQRSVSPFANDTRTEELDQHSPYRRQQSSPARFQNGHYNQLCPSAHAPKPLGFADDHAMTSGANAHVHDADFCPARYANRQLHCSSLDMEDVESVAWERVQSTPARVQGRDYAQCRSTWDTSPFTGPAGNFARMQGAAAHVYNPESALAHQPKALSQRSISKAERECEYLEQDLWTRMHSVPARIQSGDSLPTSPTWGAMMHMAPLVQGVATHVQAPECSATSGSQPRFMQVVPMTFVRMPAGPGAQPSCAEQADGAANLPPTPPAQPMMLPRCMVLGMAPVTRTTFTAPGAEARQEGTPEIEPYVPRIQTQFPMTLVPMPAAPGLPMQPFSAQQAKDAGEESPLGRARPMGPLPVRNNLAALASLPRIAASAATARPAELSAFSVSPPGAEAPQETDAEVDARVRQMQAQVLLDAMPDLYED